MHQSDSSSGNQRGTLSAWMRSALLLSAALVFAVTCSTAAEPQDWMPRVEDRTLLSWVDGPPYFLTSKTPPASEVLHFEYGTNSLLFDTKRMRPRDGEWECAVVAGGRRFTCIGRLETKDEWLQPVRFVETGRFFQRVVIEGLRFADSSGQAFAGTARLEISTWPDRLAFRLESEADATLELRHADKKATGRSSARLALSANSVAASVESELPVTPDAALGCHRIALPEKRWSNANGTYYPAEHLDRVDRWRVTLRNDSDQPAVARLMFTQERHLPITGFNAMLCDPDGTPSGLPVQISKNWHRRPEKGALQHEGEWFHGFAWVRVPPRTRRDFTLQMIYARYGGVAAASHAQLCLIGWGHNQFWDEAAIGSFGESICFEPGRVQRRCFITDVRPLMTLPLEPPGAKPWGWADNAGGGDFLMWQSPEGRYQPMKGTRTEYRSHGPCLTDVVYREESAGGEISARMEVSLPRVNDHLRVFFHLRYDVKKPVRWQRLAFFQLGSDFYNSVPARRVAIGNRAGLRDEWEPRRAKDVYDRAAMPLTGEQPWMSLHGVERSAVKKGDAMASRGLIVRSWKAMLGGKPAEPHAAFFCTEWGKGNHRTTAELVPPPGVSELRPGDFVEAELELTVFPADASAYYGPDAGFRERLGREADTWRPVQREAEANALRPDVRKGSLVKTFPLVIAVDSKGEADVVFEGGLGNIPVAFTGLTRPRGYRLLANEKPVSHWQTDWEPATQRWKMTFNPAPSPEGRTRLRFQIGE